MKKILALVLVFVSALALFACGDKAPDYKFELDKTEITMSIGETGLLAVNTDYENPSLSWSSSDPTTVDVNDFGGITAKKSGTAKITVSATFGKKNYSAECAVTVINKYNETFEETVIYPNDALDISLKGGTGIENFAYTVTVTKNGVAVENAVNENIFSVAEAGEYTLTYSVSGSGLGNSVVTRVITVAEPKSYGFISGFETTSSVYKQAASSYEITDAPDGSPSGNEKALRLEYSANEQHLRFTVPFNLLDVKNMNDGGYFELTYYISHPVVKIPYKHYGYLDIMRLPEDSSNGSIVKRYTGSMYTVNEWDTQRLYVADFKDFIGENVELYARYHMGNDKPTDGFIDYVYLSEFKYCYGDAVVNAGKDFDAAIPLAKDYDFVVSDASDESVATGNATAPIVSKDVLTVGEYKITYTLKDNSVSEKTLERKLTVLPAGSFDLSAENVMAYYTGANNLRPLVTAENVTLETAELPQGAQDGAKALKLSGDTEKLNTENGLGPKTLKTNVKFGGIRLDKIVAEPANLGKYLDITVRYNTDKVDDGTPISWQYFYIVDGADCFVSFEKLDDFVQLKANQWVNIRIPVLQIKDMVDKIIAAKTGINAVSALYPGLQIYNRDKADNYSVYVFEAKLTDGADFGEITLGDKTALRNERLDVSVSRGESGFRYTLKAEKDGADVTESVITTSGNTKYFAADTAGEYTLTYTFAAYGYNAKTVTRKITVLQDAMYVKDFDDETLYIGQTLDLSFTEAGIDNFSYTVKAILDQSEVQGVIDNENIFAPTAAGVYTIRYTVNGDGYVESTVERTVTVKETRGFGEVYNFDAIGLNTYLGSSVEEMTSDIPANAPGNKQSVLKVTVDTASGNLIHIFGKNGNAYNFMKDIDKLDDNDYYLLRFYLQSENDSFAKRDWIFIDFLSTFPTPPTAAQQIRWARVPFFMNQWVELKIKVGDFRDTAKNNNYDSLYLRMHYNTTQQTPKITNVYYYDLSLVLAEKKVAPNTEFSVGLYDSDIPEYSYEIKDETDRVVESGTNASVTITNGLAAGRYTLVYTHNSPKIADKTITRTISVTDSVLPEINGTNYIKAKTREDQGAIPLDWEIVSENLPQNGLPAGLDEAIKISGNAYNKPVVFKYMVDLLPILNDEQYAEKSIRFYVYQAKANETNGNKWSTVNLNSEMNDFIGTKGHVGVTENTADGQNTGALYFGADKELNKWHEVKYTVADLKAKYTASTVAKGLNIGMMIHITNVDVYVSALELVD